MKKCFLIPVCCLLLIRNWCWVLSSDFFFQPWKWLVLFWKSKPDLCVLKKMGDNTSFFFFWYPCESGKLNILRTNFLYNQFFSNKHFKYFNIFFNYSLLVLISGKWVSIRLCANVSTVAPRKPEDEVWALGAGLTAVCEPPNVGAGN